MKIKKIGDICKRTGAIYLLDRKNSKEEIQEQWIGDGKALYPLHNMPYLEEQNIYAIFDIDAKKQKEIMYKTGGIPEFISIEDSFDGEQHLEREAIEILYGGYDLKPLVTSMGIIYIDVTYLAPFSGTDELELYERSTHSGKTYIAVKKGLLVLGIIMPVNVIDKTFVDQLGSIANMSKVALQNIEAEEREREIENGRV